MSEERSDAACTVFKGRVVVSGGFNNNSINGLTTEALRNSANLMKNS